MDWLGRRRELGALRSALDRTDASWIRVSGARGVGKSALVRRAIGDYRAAFVRCPPLPEEAQAQSALAAVSDLAGEDAADAGSGRWESVFARLADVAQSEGPPVVLVLDDAYRLDQARARIRRPMAAFLRRMRSEGGAGHVVLIDSPPDSIIGPDSDATSDELEQTAGLDLTLSSLTLREAAPCLPGRTAIDRTRAYTIFGGLPEVLRHLDPGASVAANSRRLLLDPESPVAELPLSWIGAQLQNPTRYSAILQGLSRGEAPWSTIREAIPELVQSGQIAPYLQRLRDLHLITARRSLDAAPRSRSRRYAIADPFVTFWARFILPQRWRIGADPAQRYKKDIQPQLDEHAAGVLPSICRDYMERDASERFGANARESGSLWGDALEIPVAGVLASGAAYYGSCHWERLAKDATPLDELDQQLRATRFGFGKEYRLRVLFTAQPLPRSVTRAAARRVDAQVVRFADILGD